jgi:hypothetical protein
MIRKSLITIFALTAMVAMIQTAQATLLTDLTTYSAPGVYVSNGETLSIDHKLFSDFSFSWSGLTSFNPNNITVAASEAGGIEYLTWSGNISLTSAGLASADLKLNYVVTVTPGGGPIDMIDQAYTGSAQNGFLAIDETAAIGAFGGTIVGSSHLTGLIPSNPPSYANDVLNIVPPETALYVTKDIAFGVDSGGGFVSVSQVAQSFHQVPEPTTMIAGALLLLPFGASTLRILRKNRTA